MVSCLKVGGPNKAHTLEKNAYKIQFHKDYYKTLHTSG